MMNQRSSNTGATGQARPRETKFTVLIPTRERCDTLQATLKTCVSQDYDNLEIVVSDNSSQDNTREVALSFGDQRIRYVNTGKRVSMSANWEFALSHTNGGYVTIIGDDDGLLPGSIKRLNLLITDLHGPQAFAWKAAAYGWPSHITEGERNLLLVPLGKSLRKLDAKKALEAVAQFRALYSILPNLYNSFVHDEVLKQITRQSGRFFQSVTPDAYSGIAVAVTIDSYFYSLRPYTVNGASHHSNGASQLGEARNLQAYQKYASENDLPFHPSLVPAPSVSILTAEAILQARDHIPGATHLAVNLKQAVRYALSVAAIQSPEMYNTVVESVSAIGRLNHMEVDVAQLITQHPNRPKNNRPVHGYNLAFSTLRLCADDFEVKDIYDACVLCHHIVTLNEHGYHTLGGIAKATLQFVSKYYKGGGDHFARTQKPWTTR
jgi:glycosyltransferase involved in cell wall biosynthesis